MGKGEENVSSHSPSLRCIGIIHLSAMAEIAAPVTAEMIVETLLGTGNN